MPLSDDQVRVLVNSTSISAVAYQATSLIRELDRINDIEYPSETCILRDVLACWPRFILHQLWELHRRHPSGAPEGPQAVRVRALGRALHDLYSFVRYLTASVPRQSPPAVRVALNQLIREHFPAAKGQPVCLVRPQWKYNLKYVPLTHILGQLIGPADLDPGAELNPGGHTDLLSALWTWRQNNANADDPAPSGAAPQQLAVLSFAGLDTDDSLLYPLIAHELGHFIDYSHQPRLSLSASIKSRVLIQFDDVNRILARSAQAQLRQATKLPRWTPKSHH